MIRHAEHFHETPITARPFCIIHHDDDLLVVDKPGGIPMHSSGRYRYNSAVEILKDTLNIPRLYRKGFFLFVYIISSYTIHTNE